MAEQTEKKCEKQANALALMCLGVHKAVDAVETLQAQDVETAYNRLQDAALAFEAAAKPLFELRNEHRDQQKSPR